MLKELFDFDVYENNIKRNIALLKTLVQENTHEMTCNPQITHLLALVQQDMSIEQMARLGDVFLWHHMLILFSMSWQDAHAQQELILIHLFDNYYRYLPIDFELTIDTKSAFFPKINLFIENAVDSSATIKKLSNEQYAVVTSEGAILHIPYADTQKTGNINIINFASEKLAWLLLEGFIPSSEIQKICPLTGCLHDKITQAFSIIEAFDSSLFFDIQKNIDYLFPLHLHENKTRNSFSTAELNGTIFISDGGNLLDFCEALIHEYYHNELNIYLQFTPLFNSASTNQYFSPWRTDLRPISGLFHAIYVFIGVSLFYQKVIRQVHHHNINQQLTAIMKKINIAFCQIREEDLTVTGRQLLLMLYKIFIHLAATENIDLTPDEAVTESMALHPQIIQHQYPEFILTEMACVA